MNWRHRRGCEPTSSIRSAWATLNAACARRHGNWGEGTREKSSRVRCLPYPRGVGVVKIVVVGKRQLRTRGGRCDVDGDCHHDHHGHHARSDPEDCDRRDLLQRVNQHDGEVHDPGRDHGPDLVDLTPQIGHNIGFQAPTSSRSERVMGRPQHVDSRGWVGAEDAQETAPEMMSR